MLFLLHNDFLNFQTVGRKELFKLLLKLLFLLLLIWCVDMLKWNVDETSCHVALCCVVLCWRWKETEPDSPVIPFSLSSPLVPSPSLPTHPLNSHPIYYIIWIRSTNLMNYATTIPYNIPLPISISFLILIFSPLPPSLLPSFTQFCILHCFIFFYCNLFHFILFY